MKTKILIMTMCLGLVSLNSCTKKEERKQAETQKPCDEVYWGYSGEEGPENWGNLCADFSDCNGEIQSPIDIDANAAKLDATAPALEFSYGNTPVSIVNNGHTIQFNVASGSALTIGDKKFDLLQFHFHTASEHTVNGTHYPMEVHFVHKGGDRLAVVGVFFEEGASNPLLDNYLANFPKKKGNYEVEKTIPLAALVPQNLKYYHYDGSLTTPPCSEIVDWYVLQQPITASSSQLEQMAAIMHDNYRPVQNLNGREVLRN